MPAATVSSAPGVMVGPKLEVSPLDLRTYRAITLPNQLRALLISDLQSEKAAAAMDVAVGSYSDPPELPGLAHFLEHMLFLGTEKYPEEESYNKFLAENGGHSNAYTAAESTNFHFEMIVAKGNGEDAPMPRFKEALDRFAQFFTAPLFTESATERELNAVHSEHQKNLQTDIRRMYQVKKVRANPEHPFCKFGTGSQETLLDAPREAGIDTRAALLEFHKKYYSANIMTLCIIGPYALDELQVWVAELFSEISNHNVSSPSDEYKYLEPLLPEHRGLLYYMDTIKDIRHLELYWIVPPFVSYYQSKPGRYVGDLLGDEGSGSIISLLKAKGWADSLSAGVMDQNTFSNVQVTITLTKEGIGHIDDIVGMVYEYIRMLKEGGIQDWLYKEEAAIAENLFRFRERGSPFNLVSQMAGAMRYYPPAEYLSGQYLYKEFNAEKIMELLEHLTPENGNIIVAGKFAANKANEKERWYETPYFVERVEASRIERWKKDCFETGLHIPDSNPFIPTEFDLLAEPLPNGADEAEGPKIILQNEYMEVHHKLDRTFRRPKATIVLKLSTPMTYQSPWHSVMSNLLTSMLEDSLSEYSYAAERAGFSYGLNHVTSGIQLHVQGYSHRIDVLLAAVVKKMTTFIPDPTRFEMIRDSVERDCLNFDKSQPYSHAMYNVTCLLEHPRWLVKDYLKKLSDGSVTLQALSDYAKAVQERLYITALVSGNISEESAVRMLESVQTAIGYEALPNAELLDRRVVQVPIGKDIFSRKPHPNPDDNNSAIQVAFPTGPKGDFCLDVKVELLASILNKPTFHELRTLQQLGYIVFEGVYRADYVGGIHFIVQSTVANPDELLSRIDKFLVKFRKDVLETMSEEKFQDYVRSLVADKAEPDKKLSMRSWRFWSEIANGCRVYDRAEKEIAALEKVEKVDIVALFDDRMAFGGKERRRVVSQVFGNKHPLPHVPDVPEGSVIVENAMAFRRQNPLYPAAGIHNPEQQAQR